MSMIPTPDGAHVRHRRIVQLKAELGRNSLEFGLLLGEMRATRDYQAMGFPTFDAYLASGDVGISRRTAYTFMAIALNFAHVQHVAHGVDWGKLDILSRIVEPTDDPETVIALVEQARETPREELRAAVRAEAERKRETPAEDYALPATLVAPTPASVLAPQSEEAPFTYPERDDTEWHTAGDETPPTAAIPRVAPETLRQLPAQPDEHAAHERAIAGLDRLTGGKIQRDRALRTVEDAINTIATQDAAVIAQAADEDTLARTFDASLHYLEQWIGRYRAAHADRHRIVSFVQKGA